MPHTPGPYTIRHTTISGDGPPRKRIEIRGPEREYRGRLYADHLAKLEPDWNTHDEWLANAQLFAAAPERLATVKSAQKLVDELCKLISRAEYEAEELGKKDAWLTVGDLMGNGFMASYRDEFDAIVAKVEGR